MYSGDATPNRSRGGPKKKTGVQAQSTIGQHTALLPDGALNKTVGGKPGSSPISKNNKETKPETPKVS